MRLIHMKLALMALFWASSYPLGRYVAHFEAPSVVVFFRLAAGFLALAVIANHRGLLTIKLTPRHILHLVFLALSGFCIHNYLMFKALEYAQANTGAVINGAIPIVVAVLDFLFFGRRLSRVAIFGVVLAFVGAAMVVSHGHFSDLLGGRIGYGESLFLLGVLGWAVFTIASRELFGSTSPLTVTTYAAFIALILLFPAVLLNAGSAVAIMSDTKVMLMICIQGVLSVSFGFVWFNEGVKQIGVANASVYLNLVPVFGVILSAITLSEIPDQPLLVGGAMVVIALLIITRTEARRLRI